MSDLITPELVTLDQNLGTDRSEVIRHLVQSVVSNGRATGVDELYADAMAREAKTATGVPGGIAIPHCRSTAVTKATLAMARIQPPVDWGAKDGPADIVFFIAAPEGADQEHLQLLAKLARSLIKKDFTGALRTAASPQEVVELVDGALGLGPVPEQRPGDGAAGAGAAGAAGAAAAGAGTGGRSTGAHSAAADPGGQAGAGGQPGEGAPSGAAPGGAAAGGEGGKVSRLVAVTACPTGIAHTYMAADSLAAAAAERGIDLQVETQGSAGATALDPSIIRNADAVIFATDVDVRDKGRFAGLPLVSGPVKRGIDEPGVMIDEAIAAARDPNSRKVTGGGGGGEERSPQDTGGEGFGSQIKRALLTGVSYMIPFVAGGGLLIALGFLLGGYELSLANNEEVLNGDVILDGNTLFSPGPEGLLGYLGAVLWKIGNISLGFLVPALAGYIAYALADRPGIAPGFTAGAVALFMDAGFIGGLIGGLLAGYVARWVGSWKVPSWLRGLMPVVIIPLVTSLIASGLMIVVLGGPIAALTLALNNWLSGLTGVAAVSLGIVLGLMMGSDLGGPINKVAYAFAVAGLSEGSFENQAPWQIMAAVMAAGMVPPLAMALATVVDKQQFSMALRENGKAAWLLGAAFISEGAIPFAAADPFRVIPSSMIGGAVAGAICMGTGVTSQAPHGGIFVFFAIGNLLMFVVAILAGMVAGGLIYVALKRLTAPKTAEEPVIA